jgi:hypothetical protein
MILKGSYPMEQNLAVIECGGCHLFYLGGTGKQDDPLTDITFQTLEDSSKTFICQKCWDAPTTRKIGLN